MNNRRRSDILVNTFHIDAIAKISIEQRNRVSADRHSIVICSSEHYSESIIRTWFGKIGVDPEVTIFFWDGDETQAQHCIDSINQLLKLGYEHGFHFDTDSNRISTILNDIPGTRCIKIG